MRGHRARICSAARSPSSVKVGGMRTSTTARSGWWRSTTVSRSSALSTVPTTSMPASASRRVSPARSSTESSAITIRMAAPRAGWSARRAG